LSDANTKFYINETWKFVVWWPQWDTGLTGRKIIVDTYGGYSRHWGWAFSGKVPNKQDRSWAYIARYVAKNMVAAGFAEKLEVQLAYAIWFPQPVAINVTTFGTWKKSEEELANIIKQVFDLSPKWINDSLDLKRPIYWPTAAYGHFGREEFPWEKLDRVEELKKNF
jgi:S-adenosylmethionine synthetase